MGTLICSPRKKSIVELNASKCVAITCLFKVKNKITYTGSPATLQKWATGTEITTTSQRQTPFKAQPPMNVFVTGSLGFIFRWKLSIPYYQKFCSSCLLHVQKYHGRRKRLTKVYGWSRRRQNATTSSDKKEARILWTCYAIRWIGKRNDALVWRGKEKRTTMEKVDGPNAVRGGCGKWSFLLWFIDHLRV